MLYTYKELIRKYKSDYYIKKALKEKRIYKVDSYIYSTDKYNDYLSIINKRYPNVVICGDSAYYYYDLTTSVPDYYHIATSRKATKINNPNLNQIYVPEDKFLLGITELRVNGVEVQIYDKERLLIDLIRKSNTIPFDYYKEIINNYRLINNKLDIRKISKYLKHYKNRKRIFEAIQKEVF